MTVVDLLMGRETYELGLNIAEAQRLDIIALLNEVIPHIENDDWVHKEALCWEKIRRQAESMLMWSKKGTYDRARIT